MFSLSLSMYHIMSSIYLKKSLQEVNFYGSAKQKDHTCGRATENISASSHNWSDGVSKNI